MQRRLLKHVRTAFGAMPRRVLPLALGLFPVALFADAMPLTGEPHVPGLVTWSGAGADSHWSTAANWAEGIAPTAEDWAKFPSGHAEPWAVTLDADCEVADFYASGSTTFSGGHALTAKVSGNLFKKYNVFNYGRMTATGMGTAVHVIADNPENIATLGGGTSLVAADGATLSVDKLNFSDNGNMTLCATDTGSRLSFTLGAATTFSSASQNTGITFRAKDGGTVSQTNGYALTFESGSKATLVADGGTLNMTRAKASCNDLTLTVARNGTVNLASASLSGGNVSLTPDATWNATNAHVVTAGNLTLGGGVKYEVDVSAFASLTGSVKLAVAKAGGTLSFTAPTADVTLTGTGATDCLASLAKTGRGLYLTLTRTGEPIGAQITLDATATGGRTLPNPVSYVTCWGGPDSPSYPDFVDYAVLFTATGGDPERDQFVNPSNETTFVDYDFSRLIAKCRAALDCGVKPYLKLGNVPIKFTHGCDWQGADGGAYQFNIRPPDDDRYDAYGAYVKALAEALVAEFGLAEVRTWRFAVLTEANNPHWFQAKDGTAASTKSAFFKLYDYTAKAMTDVLGDDIVFGTHLCESVANRTFTYSDFIAHCKSGSNAATGDKGAPLSLLDFSYYHWMPDKDSAAAGKMSFVATARKALDDNGYANAVIAIDEGRVGETKTDGGGTASGKADTELITRAVGQSWQAAFDVRMAKSLLDGGGEAFASWGWFAGPDTGCEGVPAISFLTARELAKFAGMRRLAPTVTANLASSKETVEAMAAVDADGTNVLIAACHFRDKLTYTNAVSARVVVTLPAAMRGKRARLSVLTLDDANNWFVDWIADRKTYGIDRSHFWGSVDEQSPLSILVGDDVRQLFAGTLMPKYAQKVAAIAPAESTLDVPADGVVTVPVDFVGNAAVFVSLALDEEPPVVKRPLRMLTIGNSFSHQIVDLFPAAARSMGKEIDFFNCYYGGCSLQQHWENREAKGFYQALEVRFATPATDAANNPFGTTNGNAVSAAWSLADLLAALDWDVVTVQQHSVKSPDASTYEPYLGNLVAMIRALSPNAKIYFHQTWAYDRYALDWDGDVARRDAMYDGIDAAVSQMAATYGLDVIPSGYAAQLYRYRKPVTRPEDDFCSKDHLHFNGYVAEGSVGHYLQALVFVGTIFGRVPTAAEFPSPLADAALARQCAVDACAATDYSDYGQGTVDFRWNVVFQDAHGDVLATAAVTNGATATPPDVAGLTCWTGYRTVKSDVGVVTQHVVRTSAEVAVMTVFDHMTWTAQTGEPPMPSDPTTCVWTGAGANRDWSSPANWKDRMVPRDIDYAEFASGGAWDVNLDADCAVADFFVRGVTTFSGGHALTAKASGHFSSYYVFLGAPLTAAGAGTAVSVAPNNAGNRIVLGSGAALTAADGATLSASKLNFDDNGNMTLRAEGAGSKLAFTMNANTTFYSGNPGMTFKATDGGTLALNTGNALTFGSGSKATLVADGGTLDMTKATASCNDLTLTVAHGGTVRLNVVNLSGGNVILTPDATWNGTSAHVTTADKMTLGKSVRYSVDVSAWTGGTMNLAVAKAGGTLTFTTPTAGVTLTGTGASAFTATLSKKDKIVYLTLTQNLPLVDGTPVSPAAVFETARTAKPIVYPTAPTVTGTPGDQEISYGGETTKVPAHYTATQNGNMVTLALNDNARPTIADAEGEGKRGFRLKDGQVTVHAETAAEGLSYTLEAAVELDAADNLWTPVAGPQADADFTVEADGLKKFYRIRVTD